MVVTIRRIDVRSALTVGLFFTPIMYTVFGFLLSLVGMVSVSLIDYLRQVFFYAVFGAVGAAVAAYLYNVVARRFSPLKIQIEIVHESQDTP